MISFISADTCFEDWLYANYHESPEHLRHVVLAVGNEKEYDNVMAWYRKRYFKQLNDVRAAQQLTINDFMKNGGN